MNSTYMTPAEAIATGRADARLALASGEISQVNELGDDRLKTAYAMGWNSIVVGD